MHYDEGQLLAYSDGEAPADERDSIASHLRECEQCRSTLYTLESDRDLAASAMRRLQPAADVVPLPAASSGRADRPARHIRWSVVAAAAALLLIVASMTIAPVRSVAESLLKVFRVQNVQTIDISQADLQSIGDALKTGEGHIDLKSMGEVWIDGAGSEPKPVTLAQAQEAVDFPIKLPADVGAEPTLTLQEAQTYRFKLNVSAINRALEYYGSDRTLPSDVDGKVFSVAVPPIVLAQYPDPAIPSSSQHPPVPAEISVGQARSPELVVPDGVDAAELRSVLLSLPFIPQTVRDQLAAMTDWESTLVIPNVSGTARDIKVAGVPAVVMSPKGPFVQGRNDGHLPVTSTVIWNDNGVVRAVGGPIDEETAIKLANSIMR